MTTLSHSGISNIYGASWNISIRILFRGKRQATAGHRQEITWLCHPPTAVENNNRG